MTTHSGKRVTLVDVGRKCGYHYTTVGLALRNHPGIPEHTRQKILAAVEELGYRPDPALRSLIAHRRTRKHSKGYSTIAIVSDQETPDGWHSDSLTGIACFNGMRERAETLGYRLAEFTVGPDHKNEQRLDSVLKARGIAAVIIAPLLDPENGRIDLDWSAYSAISVSHSLREPRLPRVTHQHRTAAQLAVESLMRLGYRRMALMNPLQFDMRVGFGTSAGFFGAIHLYADRLEGMSFAPRHYVDLACPEAVEWIHRCRPEVILSTEQHLRDYLVDNGLRIPDELGFAALGVHPGENDIAGIHENYETVGTEVIDLIARMQALNIRGIPRVPWVHLVQGEWVQGRTVRQIRDYIPD